MTREKIRVTVWNEFHDDKKWKIITDFYSGGVHAYLGKILQEQNPDFEVTVQTLDDTDQGLADELLDRTDVLIWYSHVRDHLVEDRHIQKILDRVIHEGMGVIFLHSGVFSKLARNLIGPRGKGAYREIEELERVFVIDRSHPIADGLPEWTPFSETHKKTMVLDQKVQMQCLEDDTLLFRLEQELLAMRRS